MKTWNLIAWTLAVMGIGLAAMAATGAPATGDRATGPLPAATQPTLALLGKFTAPDVPAIGPSEKPTTLRAVTQPSTMPTWPGDGLAEHPFLYGGEGYNAIDLVKDGKIVWTYQTGGGWEIDDCWMLSNGNVLYTRMQYAEEITPDKRVVWHFDSPPGTQSHSVQPIGLDHVLLVNNGLPAPMMMMFNTTTGKVEWQHALDTISTTDAKTVHGQIRNARMTAAGTFLIPYMELNKVVEYDKDWNPIVTVQAYQPWAALRVPNGDILISGNGEGWVREVDRTGRTVWEVTANELPGITLHTVQGISRLANGDTIISSNGLGGGKPTTQAIQTSVQMVEVTPKKKVVWVIQDWQHLGFGSWIQLLDEPGIPENGEVLR
jgi:outer membrane protein assembly factor BamB